MTSVKLSIYPLFPSYVQRIMGEVREYVGRGRAWHVHDICLLVMLFLGVVGENYLVSVSAAILLLIRNRLDQLLPYLEGARLGLLSHILSIRLCHRRITSEDIIGQSLGPRVLPPVAGIAGAHLGARGLNSAETHRKA